MTLKGSVIPILGFKEITSSSEGTFLCVTCLSGDLRPEGNEPPTVNISVNALRQH